MSNGKTLIAWLAVAGLFVGGLTLGNGGNLDGIGHLIVGSLVLSAVIVGALAR